MGGLIGSIFDLAEGDPTKQEQNQLGTLGTEQIGTGEGLVTSAAGFDQGILSGDPSKIGQTLAPEISAGQGIVQQQALKDANFGTRSGGTTALTNAVQAQERGNIIDLVGGLQSTTADKAGSLGTQQESQGSTNIGTEANMATQNRQREVGDVNGIASSVSAIAAPFLGGADGAGGTGSPVPWYPNATTDAGNSQSLATDDQLGSDPLGWGIS
jgi:hypothetical protein